MRTEIEFKEKGIIKNFLIYSIIMVGVIILGHILYFGEILFNELFTVSTISLILGIYIIFRNEKIINNLFISSLPFLIYYYINVGFHTDFFHGIYIGLYILALTQKRYGEMSEILISFNFWIIYVLLYIQIYPDYLLGKIWVELIYVGVAVFILNFMWMNL